MNSSDSVMEIHKVMNGSNGWYIVPEEKCNTRLETLPNKILDMIPKEIYLRIFLSIPMVAIKGMSLNIFWKNLIEVSPLWEQYGFKNFREFAVGIQNVPKFIKSKMINNPNILSINYVKLINKNNEEILDILSRENINFKCVNQNYQVKTAIHLLSGTLTANEAEALETGPEGGWWYEGEYLDLFTSDQALPLVESGKLTACLAYKFFNANGLRLFISERVRPYIESGKLTAEQAAPFNPNYKIIYYFTSEQARPLVNSGKLTLKQLVALARTCSFGTNEGRIELFFSNKARELINSGKLTAEKATAFLTDEDLEDFIETETSCTIF